MEKKASAFKAEIAEMLNLVVNSLYSKKEIFLRELVSNASDAIDRAKFLSLTDKSIAADNPEWAIKIAIDKKAKTIAVSDNGIGMGEGELEENLGTIARSGTKKFRQMLKENEGADLPELIGQFGVGFYSAFMVADRVSVDTMKRGAAGAAFKWESDMSGEYSISDGERDFPGTTITLHLREGMEEYLDQWRIRELVGKYSDFITYPITLHRIDAPEGEKPEELEKRREEEAKPVNTMVALWKRQTKDVKDSEYEEFYKHLAHDWEGPFETIPFSGEGQVEFKALLFLPKRASMDLYMPGQKHGLSLYVRNVFISDDVEMLLPPWLRFVKGVVDSSDLPLNVSREMLQDDAVIQKIKAAVTSKLLGVFEDMKKKDAARYLEFYSKFGTVVKEGVCTDFGSAERIKKLLLYPTARGEAGKKVSFADYVAAMPQGQKDIYFVLAHDEAEARSLPQLEAALKRGFDVMLFCDQVDEYLAGYLGEFESHKFVDVSRGDVKFGTEEEQKAEKAEGEKAAKELEPLVAALKKALGDKVSDVRVTTRLEGSPCCLVEREGALSQSMIRMMKAMGQDVKEEKRILEINPSHPLMAKLKAMKEEEVVDFAELMYGSALVAEGSPVPDAAKFSRLVAELMMK